ncbi:MAG: hypothetical protein LUG95_03930 [Clostridiales bacterium]|nr:hypothetical protein [Clostridiales bacterium]
MRKNINEFCEEYFYEPPTGYDFEEDYDIENYADEEEFISEESKLFDIPVREESIKREAASPLQGVWLVNMKNLSQFDCFCKAMEEAVKSGYISGENMEYGEKSLSPYINKNNKNYIFTAETIDVIYPRFLAQKLAQTIEKMKGGIYSFDIIPSGGGMLLLIGFTGMAKKIAELDD